MRSATLSLARWSLAAAVAGAGCGRESAPPPASAAGDSAAAAAAIPLPQPTVSHFVVPLEYDFTSVLAVVERALPKTFGSLDSARRVGDDDRKHYAFVATRGPITAYAHDSEVHLRATLSYQARGYYKPLVGPTLSAGCGGGKDPPQIVIELVTPLTVTNTWHLQSAMSLGQLSAASDSARDHCQVSILKFDVTDRVLDAARKGMTGHLPDIDRKVAAIDLTPRAAKWWEALNRPIPLTNGVWLVLRPRRLRLGPVSGEGQMLTVRAGLDAYPKILTGVEPHLAVPALPPLAKDTVATGFRIVLDGVVDYATASRALSDGLRGKTIAQNGHSVTVQSVIALPGATGQLALDVRFTGDAAGIVRFIGTPRYDTSRAQIIVPDLDYDLKTTNEFVKAYAWIRSDALRALFREKAKVPVAPVLERGRELLTSGLNRKIGGVLALSATVDSVAVNGLYVTSGGLMVRASARGSARAKVRARPGTS